MQSGDPTGDSLYYPVLQGVVAAGRAARRSSACTRRPSTRTRGARRRPRSTPGSTATSSSDPGTGRPRGPAGDAPLVPPLSRRAGGAGSRAGGPGGPLRWPASRARLGRRCSGCSSGSSSSPPAACFLVLAVSPRLFAQGPQWFTLTYLRQTLTGATAIAVANSLWVSVAAARWGWRSASRSPGWRHAPRCRDGGSWPAACGWSCCCPRGCRRSAGSDWSSRTACCTGSGSRRPASPTSSWGRSGWCCCSGCAAVPFTFLAITAALAGLGPGIRGRRPGPRRRPRPGALRLILPILAPAIWSALAIGFAESVSDFGVAATLAYNSQLPARHLPALRGHQQLPAQLPRGRGDRLAARRLRGAAARAAGPGAARPVVRGAVRADPAGHRGASSPARARWRRSPGRGCSIVVALGVPGFGAVSGSLLGDYGGSLHA